MNSVFSADRFIKLLKYDLRTNLPKFYITFCMLCSIVPAFGIIALAFGESISLNARDFMYTALLYVCSFVSPFVIYKHANNRKGGIYFITLPASAFEKFLSILVVCSLIVPLAFIIANILLDYILSSTLFYVAYEKYVGLFGFRVWQDIFTLLRVIGFCILGNLYFVSSKLSKTFFSGLGLIVIGSVFWGATGITYSVINELLFSVYYDASRATEEWVKYENCLLTVRDITRVVLMLSFYLLAYLRIKKLQLK